MEKNKKLIEQRELEKTQRVEELNRVLSSVNKYYDLYDLFNELIDYNNDENDEVTVENFLNHHKTKEVFDYIDKWFRCNKHIIETENTVVGDDLAVCCALMFIDTDKYLTDLITSTPLEIDTHLFSYYQCFNGDYNLMYLFKSKEEEDAWNEHCNFKMNVENIDIDEIYDDEYINNWLENYRKEHKNER